MRGTGTLKGVCLLAGVVGLIAFGTASAAAAPVVPPSVVPVHVGVLRDGAVWQAKVPSNWNGTLLLFSHGFGPTLPAVAPQGGSGHEEALLERGYALAGSSYDPKGSMWALNSAVRDQFETLEAVKRSVLPAPPTRVIAVGESMGGLVSSLENQESRGRLDGVLTLCGLVAGGANLENYQLHGSHVISALLAPDQHIQLAGYQTVAQAALAAVQLQTAAQSAQETPQGRARLALASAFYNVTTWAANQDPPAAADYDAQQQAQYDTQYAPGSSVLPFIQTGRWSIEQAVGGQPSWNVGVDYPEILHASPYRAQVEALYNKAGLDLAADLQTLVQSAAIKAEIPALDKLIATSVATGRLEVPQLNIHTVSDELIPVQHENFYRRTVEAAGSGDLLRQAFVGRQGHCNFAPAEVLAALHALEHRVHTGRWDDAAGPESLQAAASALDEGGAAYVPYEPDVLTATNGPFDPETQGLTPGGILGF